MDTLSFDEKVKILVTHNWIYAIVNDDTYTWYFQPFINKNSGVLHIQKKSNGNKSTKLYKFIKSDKDTLMIELNGEQWNTSMTKVNDDKTLSIYLSDSKEWQLRSVPLSPFYGNQP